MVYFSLYFLTEHGIIIFYTLHLETECMGKEMPGFSSGVTGTYEAPKVKRVVLDEDGNDVGTASQRTGAGAPGSFPAR